MLEADGLASIRGERVVFSGLSFRLMAGHALLITGPNGAGKSTLLRVLAGLCGMAAGRLLWYGEAALTDPVAHARRVAYLGHEDAVKLNLSVAENLAPWGGHSAVAAALEEVGLDPLADLPARLLSAGQRRRLALARLLLRRAPLWLLDEPTLGLDDVAVARFGAMLARHRADGGIVVAATHLPLPLPGAARLVLGGSSSDGDGTDDAA